MKHLIHLFVFFAVSLFASAQVPGNRVNASDSIVITRNYISAADTVIENRLIELALKSPAYSASGHQIKIDELELKKAKNSWLNLLSISTNYNDQTLAKTSNTSLVYPKYFFGLTIPLGVIFSQGSQVKTAREGVALRKDQQEELRRSIKADILSKYKQYKLYYSLIEIHSELVNDVLAKADQAEKDFKKDMITVEAYTAALKTKNDELTTNLNLKFQRDLIKLQIEQIIGMPLELVLQSPVTSAAK